MRFDCAGSHEMYVCDLGCSRSGLILGRARARTKCSLRSTSCLLLSRLLFSCCQSHLHDMLLRLTVKSRYAFRLCRLAHCLRRRFGSRHFPVNFRMKWLLQNLDMRFDCLVKF